MDWKCFIYLVLILIELTLGKMTKSSLTFVIDDTASMGDDIEGVKISANLVFDMVLNTNSSQIEDFNLVTFNDPVSGKLLVKTRDRDLFKRHLNSIKVYGGGDCPELSMAGIMLALKESLPGSYLYVYTDATAKDAALLETVQNLAVRKHSQIIFLLTGKCNSDKDEVQFKAYYKLAEATLGQVFHIGKNHVDEILKYVAETVRSPKTVVLATTLPAGYGHNVSIPVDPSIPEVVVSVSGSSPKVDITAPGGSKPKTEVIVDLPTAVVVKVPAAIPGNYTAAVGSSSSTTVVASASTSILFKYGFLPVEPTSISDTATQPISGVKSHLAIELEAEKGTAVLDTVQIMDMDEKLIAELPLKLINKKQQLYGTKQFLPPDFLFKIAVNGHDVKSKTPFRRTSSGIQPQKPTLEMPVNKKPTIKVTDALVKIEYDKSLKLMCKINGYPKPDAIWVDGDGNLLPSTLTVIAEPYDYLTILDIANVKKSGVYTCKATNSIGDTAESIEVDVVKEKPVINKTTSVMRIKRGEDVEIRCSISRGKPPPTMTWYVQHNDSLDYVKINETNEVINLKKVDESKTGTFKCIALNEMGSDDHVIHLIVEYPPRISNKINNVISKEGSVTTLNCKVKGEPKPDVNWFLNGEKIFNGRKHHINGDNSIRFPASLNNAGRFMCVASNSIGTDNNTIEVDYFEKPVINKTTSIMRVQKGEDVEIRCSITRGRPPPTITWYVQYNDYQDFIKMNETDEVIILKNVNERKTGTFRCIAGNEMGHDDHVINLIVKYPPRISYKKSYVASREGRNTRLDCRVKGEPKPRVNWFFNGEKIVSSRKHHIYRDNSLRFRGSLNNAGRFMCLASNSLGTDNNTIVVDYIGPVTIKSPEQSTFTKKLGDDLELPCHADGYPRPYIKWLFFDSITDRHPEIIRSVDDSGALNLKNLRSNQDGYYVCIASNRVTSANMTYQVNVYAPPNIEVTAEKTVTAVLGDLLTILPCSATGNPKPDITWTKNGFNIASGTDWYDMRNGDLIIKNVVSMSGGTYVCHAVNDLGQDSEMYNIIVKPYPDETPTKTITLDKDSSSTIECDIPHSKVDSIRWYKNGILLKDREITIRNAKPSDSGTYTCRVQSITTLAAQSTSVRVMIGSKPRFDPGLDPNTSINFEKDTPAVLDCTSSGDPEPEVTWYAGDKKIKFSKMQYDVVMTYDTLGNYTCVVSNSFGAIRRNFEIVSKDCLLNIKTDLANGQPLLLDMHRNWPVAENTHGHIIRVLSGETMILSCPDGFKNMPYTEVHATCEREKKFYVNGKLYEYPELACLGEMNVEVKHTGKQCVDEDSEELKVGFKAGAKFVEAFEVCLSKENNIPVYAKHRVQRSLADTEPAGVTKWYNDESLPLNLDEVYNCDFQISQISSLLGKWFHDKDRCCFKKRQLVNSRDLPAGLAQKAAFSYLNVVPQWSSCNSKNWDELERRVRNLAKNSYDDIIVWTGTAGRLKVKNGYDEMEALMLEDKEYLEQAVPNYIWKVVQNPYTNTTLAVVQLNIPDLTPAEAYRHMVCVDICRDIPWMKGHTWRKASDGYTFCCDMEQFEKAFKFENIFGAENKRVFYGTSDLSLRYV